MTNLAEDSDDDDLLDSDEADGWLNDVICVGSEMRGRHSAERAMQNKLEYSTMSPNGTYSVRSPYFFHTTILADSKSGLRGRSVHTIVDEAASVISKLSDSISRVTESIANVHRSELLRGAHRSSSAFKLVTSWGGVKCKVILSRNYPLS
jgi:hypothetical protein